jgi:hypothetical protein
MSENVDKLISLAAEFFAAQGGVVEAHSADIPAFRASAIREWPQDWTDRQGEGQISIESALTPMVYPDSTRCFVALDGQGRVVGALSQSTLDDSFVHNVGTTGEVRGSGAALLMAAALSTKKDRVKLSADKDSSPYYARLGFETVKGVKSINFRPMLLRGPEVARIQRSVPQIIGL